MKFGIQRVLLVGFGAAVLAVGVTTLAAYRHFRDEERDIAEAIHADQVLTELDSILLLSTASQSAIRGYAITGRESYLGPHQEALTKLPAQIGKVRELTRNTATQQQRMPELERSVSALLERQRGIVQLARENGMNAAQNRINAGGGIEALQAVRDAIDAMRTEEQQLRPTRWHEAELRRKEAYATTTLLTAATVGLLALCYVLVRYVLAIRQQREQSLQRLAATLDERVRERTVQLATAQRKQAELAAIVESSTDAIVSVDVNWNFATWNHGAERLLGYRMDEIIGRPVWTVIPPDREGEMSKVKERIARGEAVGPFETARRHKDGRIIPVAATASPIRDSEGRVIGTSGILHDISERKRLEAEVSRISDYEQQRLGHDLHDGIGQQLTAIELMLYQVDDEHSDRREEQLDRIGQTVRETIRDVRTLARGLAPFIVDEGGLQTALLGLVSTSVKAETRCRFVCPDNLPHIDQKVALQLYRIAQEAFNNAAKHANATDIEIRLQLRAHTLQLTVADNGRGCPCPPEPSAGIGRQIMPYRAALIGADYEFTTTPGKGVTVTCSLPLPS